MTTSLAFPTQIPDTRASSQTQPLSKTLTSTLPAPNPSYPDDVLALRCLQLGQQAAQENSFAVGAVICNANGTIVSEGRNRVFAGRMDSGAHAEMRAINDFEENPPCSPREAELFVLLELCPMCTSRALYAGFRSVRWVLPDHDGGMMHRVNKLPPAWKNLAQLQHHAPARVSPALYKACEELLRSQRQSLRQRWRDHMGL